MNRMVRAVIAVVFVGIITFSAISISQTLTTSLRVDITDQKIYTLSNGTMAILNKLRQPIKLKLYYTKTAAMKISDPVRFYMDYFYFIESLLREYANVSNGMIKVEVIDPRPFTDEEADALRYGLNRVPLSEEESFFFGLVAQTQFGAVKSLPFLMPERQEFVEYDISYLIDTVLSRQKKRIGVISSLPVMGEDISGYLAQMMIMQGQTPPGPWLIVDHLRQKYEVRQIKSDVEEINDVDILLVIHPRKLPEKTLFAIDQFVVKGGRTVVCVDPYCYTVRDQTSAGSMPQPYENSSNLAPLMKTWGLEMPDKTFAGDRDLALVATFDAKMRPQKILSLLGLTDKCFNPKSAISGKLNAVKVLFPGFLKEIDVADSNEVKIERTPLVFTTARGNAWAPEETELIMPDPISYNMHFTDGNTPLNMAYLVTGRFKSAFPGGIRIKSESDPNVEPRQLTGLNKANTDCAVVVFGDVDFISDLMAYQDSYFGKVAAGDNASLLLNAVDELCGSSDLISIRSRGNFKRPFIVVDKIEAEAEKGTAEEEEKINKEIDGFREELNKTLASVQKGQEEVVGGSILEKKKELELKLREAQMRLRDVKMKKRERIEELGNTLRDLNTLPGPVLVLLIAVNLGLWRTIRKRRYISHASDA